MLVMRLLYALVVFGLWAVFVVYLFDCTGFAIVVFYLLNLVGLFCV